MDTLIRETKPKPGELPEIIPAQYWDPDSDDGNGAYEKIRGTRGAPRVLLWGADGAPLLTEEYPGHMDMIDRAARLLGKVSADDGSLVTLGAIADAVVAAGDVGTLSAKLRRLTTDLDALLTKVGEIQASPTANTILARLKDIKDGIPLTGSILGDETDKAVTTNTDILTDYNATKTMQTTLMVATNTSGIIKLEVDGSLNSLNGGISLDSGKWYAFDIPVLADSVYNLQFSVNTTLQIKWIGGF